MLWAQLFTATAATCILIAVEHFETSIGSNDALVSARHLLRGQRQFFTGSGCDYLLPLLVFLFELKVFGTATSMKSEGWEEFQRIELRFRSDFSLFLLIDGYLHRNIYLFIVTFFFLDHRKLLLYRYFNPARVIYRSLLADLEA